MTVDFLWVANVPSGGNPNDYLAPTSVLVKKQAQAWTNYASNNVATADDGMGDPMVNGVSTGVHYETVSDPNGMPLNHFTMKLNGKAISNWNNTGYPNVSCYFTMTFTPILCYVSGSAVFKVQYYTDVTTTPWTLSAPISNGDPVGGKVKIDAVFTPPAPPSGSSYSNINSSLQFVKIHEIAGHTQDIVIYGPGPVWWLSQLGHNGNHLITGLINWTATLTDSNGVATQVCGTATPAPFTADVRNVVITDTLPADPDAIAFDPVNSTLTPYLYKLSVTFKQCYTSNKRITLRIFDGQQNLLKTMITDRVVRSTGDSIGGSSPNGLSYQEFMWDGSADGAVSPSASGGSGTSSVDKGIYLFQFDINDLSYTGAEDDKDKDKSDDHVTATPGESPVPQFISSDNADTGKYNLKVRYTIDPANSKPPADNRLVVYLRRIYNDGTKDVDEVFAKTDIALTPQNPAPGAQYVTWSPSKTTIGALLGEASQMLIDPKKKPLKMGYSCDGSG